MSTNYYAHFEDRKIMDLYFTQEEYEKEIKEDSKELFSVHLGKRSMGWKPLFEAHQKAYSSVENMLIFLERYASDIVDEYGESLTLKNLKEELVDWNKNLTPSEKFYSEEIGYMTIPIDHTLFAKRAGSVSSIYKNAFYNDKDGYNFLIGNFS